MMSLTRLIEASEDWLMERILMYAEDTGYTAYTSTLKEAWRLSISGLSQSIINATKVYDAPPKFNPEFDFTKNPVAKFGVVEAQRHMKRGISLSMFMGLMKYYRQAYVDLLETSNDISGSRATHILYINRIFDIIEISFCTEWAGGRDDQVIKNMQTTNMEMTNEKNKYLTIFESMPNPVLLVDHDGFINNMNMIAASFFNSESTPGGQYYKPDTDDEGCYIEASKDETAERRTHISQLLPWLYQELQDFQESKLEKNPFIKKAILYNKEYKFNVRVSAMLDVSHKFKGMVLILEDITKLAASELEIKKLAGLVPICSYCKKMRDDKGYWNQLEKYIEERSDALFSHSICESCMKEHYKEIVE